MKKSKMKVNSIKTEDQEEMIRLFKILLVVIVFIAGVYVFTKKVVKKEDSDNTKITEGKIDYNKIIIGSLLSQSFDDYYVFAYDANNAEAIYYDSIIASYMKKTDAKKVFWADLSNSLNEKFKAKNKKDVNTNAKSLDDLLVGDFTLFKIKKGKIEKIIDNASSAKKELGLN